MKSCACGLGGGDDLGFAGADRQQIAYVGQVVQLFRGSIRDNIALGRVAPLRARFAPQDSELQRVHALDAHAAREDR
jgi:ABC-type iron transport system FetAB ATPase subunit